jgi:oxygen-independent coproporphyrinogen-3 oxidase
VIGVSTEVNNLPPWLWPRAAYVHIPFCAHRCGYCDFAIAVGQDHAIGDYLRALAGELAGLGTPRPVETLFLGGGTPTHLDAAALSRLFDLLAQWLPLREGGELSIEANPDSLTPEKVRLLSQRGVTRVSIGVQSFQPELLRALDRTHSADDVPRAVEAARSLLPHVSVDLIFGVPGQTLQQWRDDLDRAVALGPDHVSTYGLTYEKGTPLWKERRRGRVRPLDEDEELGLYALAIDTLEDAGFEHYEISNFARTGGRSRHNQVYWANEAHFGFGMGAARYVLGRRELNTRDLSTYVRRLLRGESPTFQSEELPPEERARETMAMQLRRAEGINRNRFLEQTGYVLDAIAGASIHRHQDLGLLDDDGQRVWLTRPGKYVADGVITALL